MRSDFMFTPAFRPLAVSADATVKDINSSSGNNLQFRLFAGLWAIASLFHMAHSGIFADRLNYALLTLTAIYVIFNPALTAFICLILLQLLDVFITMPGTSNHWIFTGFVNITILFSLLYLIIKKRTYSITGGELLQTFAPVVRAMLIILYFFAVLHKLNSGFFNADLGCTTFLLRDPVIESFISISPTVLLIGPYFTLLIEAIIPIFLCFRKTRNVGILIGLIFHFALAYSSYNAFYDFSSMTFALYFLFTSKKLSFMLVEKWAKLRTFFFSVSSRKFRFRDVLFLSLYILASLAIIFAMTKILYGTSFRRHFFWAGYSFTCIYFFITYLRSKETANKNASVSFRFPGLIFLVFPVLVFLNGMSPYLGFKTENSFAMFSNLRTEGGFTNHYIIPSGLQVFNYQKDLVEVVSSSDPYLQAQAEHQKIMVYFDFRKHISENRPQRVEYIRNGKAGIFDISKASPGDELLVKHPYLFKKLMRFRSINKFEPQPCAH